jgi:hypothetical protein
MIIGIYLASASAAVSTIPGLPSEGPEQCHEVMSNGDFKMPQLLQLRRQRMIPLHRETGPVPSGVSVVDLLLHPCGVYRGYSSRPPVM